jgi:glycerate kinase
MPVMLRMQENPMNLKRTVVATFDEFAERYTTESICREIVEKISNQYVKENYQRIVSAIGDESVLDAVSQAVREKVKQILETK